MARTFDTFDVSPFINMTERDVIGHANVPRYFFDLLRTAKVERVNSKRARVVFSSPVDGVKVTLEGYYNTVFCKRQLSSDFVVVDIHLIIRDLFVWLVSMTQSPEDAFLNAAECKSSCALLADAFLQHFQGLNSGFARNSAKLYISPRWTAYGPLGYPADFDGDTAIFSEAFRIAHNPDELPNGQLRENRVKANRVSSDHISDFYRVSATSIVQIPSFSCTVAQAMDFLREWKPSLRKHAAPTYEDARTLDVQTVTAASPLGTVSAAESESGWLNPAFDDIVESGRLTKLLQAPFVLDELDIAQRFKVINSELCFATYGTEHFPIDDVTMEQVTFLGLHQRTLKVVFLAQQARVKISAGDIMPVRNISRMAFAYMREADLPVFEAVGAGFYDESGNIIKIMKFNGGF